MLSKLKEPHAFILGPRANYQFSCTRSSRPHNEQACSEQLTRLCIFYHASPFLELRLLILYTQGHMLFVLAGAL